MSKFLLVFDDGRPPVGLNTQNQVRVFLQRSVPDVNRVSIYKHATEATRDGWNMGPLDSRKGSSDSKPVYHGTRWTETETLQALEMRKEGVSLETIGIILQRTTAAVANRVNQYAP